MKCMASYRDLLVDRFVLKTKKATGQCIEWQAGKDKDGYGKIRIGGKGTPTRRANRVAYELFCGPIPDGMRVLHKCDNPMCVKPGHLFLGTSQHNSADMKDKGRQAKGSRNGSAKLSEEDVTVIRLRHAEGDTQAEIAADFKIRQTQVSNIVRRQCWADS